MSRNYLTVEYFPLHFTFNSVIAAEMRAWLACCVQFGVLKWIPAARVSNTCWGFMSLINYSAFSIIHHWLLHTHYHEEAKPHTNIAMCTHKLQDNYFLSHAERNHLELFFLPHCYFISLFNEVYTLNKERCQRSKNNKLYWRYILWGGKSSVSNNFSQQGNVSFFKKGFCAVWSVSRQIVSHTVFADSLNYQVCDQPVL